MNERSNPQIFPWKAKILLFVLNSDSIKKQDTILIYFYLLIIFTLQHCIGLPHINMNPPWVYMCSQSRTPLPPSLPQHHPSESSQCTSPKHPAPCIEPRLAICFLYDIIHVSMARREWQDILKVMKENNLQPRLLYPARISFKYERETGAMFTS